MNCGDRNSRSGSIGCALRCSTTTKATSVTAPTTAATIAAPLPWSIAAYEMLASATVINAAPGMSSGAWSDDRVSGTCRIEIQIVAAASGTLIRNTSRQLTASIIQPPRNGPIELATPASPDHAPIARPRSSGWNVAAMIARLPGHEQRAADALQRAGRDQEPRRRRQTAQHGRDGEDRGAGDEHGAVPVAVAERAAEQQQRRQRDEVGVHDPLQAHDRRAEVVADRGQSDVDDRAVEERHAGPEHRRGHGPARGRRAVPNLGRGGDRHEGQAMVTACRTPGWQRRRSRAASSC